MWADVRELYAYRETLLALVGRELRSRYKGSVLGFLWTLGNPMLMLVIYNFVFSFVARVAVDNYSMYLFVALLPWFYLSTSLLQASASIIHNADLVKKTYFPRAILPLSVVIANLINYLLSLGVLIPALLLSGIRFDHSLAAFPLIVLTQTMLVTGVALLVAAANVYFRDLQHLLGVGVTAWFFLTPVVFPAELVPPQVRTIFMINPMGPLIVAYRDVMFYSRWPDMRLLGLMLVGCGLALGGAFTVFTRLSRNLAEEI